ncbi:hypothetical protein [Virgisporangium aurantiacum]|uniref:Lipoprotein n=1 Tax=Virgisporangium aurantiacum TaxID=175570 RepID=A0A8J3YZK3_9ACTN|nr:hypothetical protein [Virgisporangium aurantiacum]GIJ54919.1 hypothetical protein Vau01_024350 [Virgisporangium aurantiacum]
MSVTRWAAPLLLAIALAGCTVSVEPDASASGGPSSPAPGASGSGSSGAGCPWAENRGQAYEPETGRIKLVSTCLDTQAAGAVYRTAAVAERAGRYTDGTPVAVLCIDFGGESYRDSGGYASKIWFKIDNDGGTGYVPHAATGYADINAEDAC